MPVLIKEKKVVLFYLIGLFLFFIHTDSFGQHELSQGNWVKLAFTSSGIYKIDYSYLKAIGLNPDQINPKNIHIHGYGGGMLLQNNSGARFGNLPENAIIVQGESDGQFNEQDYVLFYVQGPDKWTYDPISGLYAHEKNLYSDSTFYFITVNQTLGLRVQNSIPLSAASQTIQTYDEYRFYEQDKINILQSGRYWYGDIINASSGLNISMKAEGIVAGTNLKLTSAIVANLTQNSAVAIKTNGQLIGSQAISAISQGRYDPKAIAVNNTFTFNQSLLASGTDIGFNLLSGSNNGIVYLDYLRLQYTKSLQWYGSQSVFRSSQSMNFASVNYLISQTGTDLNIWDVSNPQVPINQSYQLNANQASFTANTNGMIKEYALFSASSLPSPASFQIIGNQDLRGLLTPDLVIVSTAELMPQAKRIADFRTAHDGFLVHTVNIQHIYNEFASGRQDVTAIRDFVRYLYLQNPAKLKYVLLFGDASYDYKNRISPNTNLIPIYESRESLQPLYSYSSDDYFGFMENAEGDWFEGNSPNPAFDHTSELGVGRITCRNIQEAQIAADKIIRYGSELKTLGTWRNKVCFVADDGDGNIHVNDAEKLSDTLRAKYKNYNINKLYVDAFPQVAVPNGETVPALKDALNKTLDNGALIVNYTGHGAEIGWAEEDVLDVQQIKDWDNFEYLPLVVTATCEFGRYDDPFTVSGAEYALLNPYGGAIALISTTRPVFAYTNFLLNKAFYSVVFEPINGQMPRLGDLIRLTKNNSLNGSLNRNFSLLGDPSLRLAYPEQQVVVTQLNQKTISSPLDTLKALSKINVAGEIRNSSNVVLSDFNGSMEVSIFDKDQVFTTLGNQNAKINYKLMQNLLFKGIVKVRQGIFSFDFVVPKDINYQFGKGKMSFYAQKSNTYLDAGGYFDAALIGGSQKNPTADNTAPDIQLFMDNENFVSGGEVRPNTLLIAKISDDSGINISRFGIGHDLLGTINQTDQYVMNDYYTADTNSYQKGTIRYPFTDLSLGRKTLNLKVWDTYNNPAEKSIDFIVVENSMEISSLFNFPNPFIDHTNFQVSHNRETQDLSVQILIYDSYGAKRKELYYSLSRSEATFTCNWDGRDDSGNPLGPGVYIYKFILSSDKDGAKAVKEGRLVVLK